MAAYTYTVTSQQPDQYDFSTPGNPVLGTIVYFQTGAGNTGSVFVPAVHYTVANVKTAVAAKAKLLDEVGGITGSGS
jgi:hypothetical protein